MWVQLLSVIGAVLLFALVSSKCEEFQLHAHLFKELI